jgi:cellobiose phosphorylase
MLIAEAVLGDGDQAHRLFAMLNPISHGATPEAVERYKVEPYVVAADIYTAPGHVGRGGWTWYTGSAGWLYRAGIEWILGIRKVDGMLRIAPCIPDAWPGFRATVRHGRTRYTIEVDRGAKPELVLDGKAVSADAINLADDGKDHLVRLRLGQPQRESGRNEERPASANELIS